MTTDRQITAALRALAKVAYDEKIQRIFIDVKTISDSLAYVFNESDRSYCIVACSLLEDTCRYIFTCHLTNIRKEDEAILFGESGIFGTNMKLLRAAYHLGWLKTQTFHGIQILAKIRNLFAHRPDIHSFEHNHVATILQKIPDEYQKRFLHILRAAIQASDYPSSFDERLVFKDRRHMFTCMFVSLLCDCITELKYMPISKSSMAPLEMLIELDREQDAEHSDIRRLIRLLLEMTLPDERFAGPDKIRDLASQ